MQRQPMSLSGLAHRTRRLVPLVVVLWLSGWLGGLLGTWSQALAAQIPHEHLVPHDHSSPQLAQQPHDHLQVPHHHLGFHQHGHASSHRAHSHPEGADPGHHHGPAGAPTPALDQPGTVAAADVPAVVPSGPVAPGRRARPHAPPPLRPDLTLLHPPGPIAPGPRYLPTKRFRL